MSHFFAWVPAAVTRSSQTRVGVVKGGALKTASSDQSRRKDVGSRTCSGCAVWLVVNVFASGRLLPAWLGPDQLLYEGCKRRDEEMQGDEFLTFVCSVAVCVWCVLQSKVYVHVNKLDSVETIIPYEYSR